MGLKPHALMRSLIPFLQMVQSNGLKSFFCCSMCSNNRKETLIRDGQLGSGIVGVRKRSSVNRRSGTMSTAPESLMTQAQIISQRQC